MTASNSHCLKLTFSFSLSPGGVCLYNFLKEMTIYVNKRDCWLTRQGLSWPGSKQRLVLDSCWCQNRRPGSHQEGTEASGHATALQPARGNTIILPGLSGWLCNVPQNRVGLYKNSCFQRQKYFHSSLSIRQGTCFLWLAVAETNPQGVRGLQLRSPAAPPSKTAEPRAGQSQ